MQSGTKPYHQLWKENETMNATFTQFYQNMLGQDKSENSYEEYSKCNKSLHYGQYYKRIGDNSSLHRVDPMKKANMTPQATIKIWRQNSGE